MYIFLFCGGDLYVEYNQSFVHLTAILYQPHLVSARIALTCPTPSQGSSSLCYHKSDYTSTCSYCHPFVSRYLIFLLHPILYIYLMLDPFNSHHCSYSYNLIIDEFEKILSHYRIVKKGNIVYKTFADLISFRLITLHPPFFTTHHCRSFHLICLH